MVRRAWLAGLVLSVALTGCASRIRPPDLGGLYSDLARNDAERNPVIVIPGILGSRLVDRDGGRTVWGAFGGEAADARTAEGLRLLALPMREGAALSELSDSVVPAGVLDRIDVNLAGLHVRLQAYAKILATLGVGGYRDEALGRSGAIDYRGQHYTCFQFDYDWRRDNVENARHLADFIADRKEYVRAQMRRRGRSGEPKFDIVAHSMGGLVARYFLQYGAADLPADGSLPTVTWAGAADVERVVLIGTPNAGSVEALVELVNGSDFGPLVAGYPPAVLGTMPSVYQLLPRGRHGQVVELNGDGSRGAAIAGVLDPPEWERRGWCMADAGQAEVLRQIMPETADAAVRRRIALEHQHKCLERARRFHAALDQPATRPAGLSMYLFAGDAVATPAVVGARGGGPVRVVGNAPGDGTVTRASALMDERLASSERRGGLVSPIDWSHVTFIFSDHIGLTRDEAFTDNVLYLLLEQPR